MTAGYGYERELVDSLRDHGYRVIPAAASGSRTSEELPDLLAGQRWKRGSVTPANWPRLADSLGIEAKATSENIAYFTEEEVDELCEFCADFGAEARLGARFKGRRDALDTPRVHFLVDPSTAERTDGGNYRVHVENAAQIADIAVDHANERIRYASTGG